jgi:energy-coupling factor transport system ATP-binding protein
MIQIQSLTYRYPGNEHDTLKGITAQFHAGEIVALMGANGSGKTTFIRCLNGLIQPTSGEVLVDGTPPAGEHLFEVRRKVGMVFQNPDNQIVATTVEREIAFGLENLGTPTAEMKSKVDLIMKHFSLTEYRHTPPHLLSGGEKQRLALAAVIVMDPDYLILDEPTSLLDPKARQDLLRYLIQYSKEGMGIILVTQFSEEAMVCDRLLILNGSIALEGAPRTVFSKMEQVRELGVQIPVDIELDILLKKLSHAD